MDVFLPQQGQHDRPTMNPCALNPGRLHPNTPTCMQAQYYLAGSYPVGKADAYLFLQTSARTQDAFQSLAPQQGYQISRAPLIPEP